MYLESLKTYELFGNSETLFARAAESSTYARASRSPWNHSSIAY